MTKRQALEQLREAIRQARVERDNGNDAAHDRIQYLTGLVQTLSSLKGQSAKDWIASRQFNE